MNALANSQHEEIQKFLENVTPQPISVRRYTGQEDDKNRQEVAESPPDILLTNFMMLEYLMTRQDELDKKVIGNCEGLQYLVLDEMHTYPGRQGADVALLVRRMRARLAAEKFHCIGTSATMASGDASSRTEAVARVIVQQIGERLGGRIARVKRGPRRRLILCAVLAHPFVAKAAIVTRTQSVSHSLDIHFCAQGRSASADICGQRTRSRAAESSPTNQCAYSRDASASVLNSGKTTQARLGRRLLISR